MDRSAAYFKVRFPFALDTITEIFYFSSKNAKNSAQMPYHSCLCKRDKNEHKRLSDKKD
jgi:hypothetical protein